MAGVVLAAGGGSRMGRPKALVRDETGTPWGARTARLLLAAGCEPVVVVVGAAAEEVRGTLADLAVQTVLAPDWAEGMAASLRAGLRALPRTTGVTAALVCPVDTPGLDAAVVRRLAALADPDMLARATYDGVPGHPVLLGEAHWDAIAAQASGDAGARDYLAGHRARPVECADVADGADVDHPGDLPDGHRLG